MHDPRIGRFLSIDPLAPEYPFYSPYAFSGNRVIDMFELEGLEPVKGDPEWGKNIILGGPQHEAAISDERLEIAKNKVGPNTNWIYRESTDIFQAAEQIKQLRSEGAKPKNVVINSHGTGDGFVFDTNDDMPIYSPYVTDVNGLYIRAAEMDWIMYARDRGDDITKWPKSYQQRDPVVDALESILGNMEKGGCLIFATCNSGTYRLSEEDPFGTLLVKLGENKISVLLNMDYTRNPLSGNDYSGNHQYLNVPLTVPKNKEYGPRGWIFFGENDGFPVPNPKKDVQLNSTGTPVYDIITPD